MKNKIPCGGFYLDDMLNVNDNGELSIKGGTPYQQLVTDGDGNTKWEDRLAYENGATITYDGNAEGRPSILNYIKISDLTPSPEDVIGGVYRIFSLSDTYITQSHIVDYSGTDYFGNIFAITQGGGERSPMLLICFVDNFKMGEGMTIPEKGIYSLNSSGLYVELFSYGTIKKIDEKFLPVMDSVILNSSTTSSTKKFKITVDDTGTISATEVT